MQNEPLLVANIRSSELSSTTAIDVAPLWLKTAFTDSGKV